AGYQDATRLEWAMEDRLGGAEISIGRRWEIEGYTLQLALQNGVPSFDIHKGERALKRAPTAVTRDYVYREARETLEQARDQERRYRQTFLDAMRTGLAISADELGLLRRNPLAAGLLERLVAVDEAGACGLVRLEDCSLEG